MKYIITVMDQDGAWYTEATQLVNMLTIVRAHRAMGLVCTWELVKA